MHRFPPAVFAEPPAEPLFLYSPLCSFPSNFFTVSDHPLLKLSLVVGVLVVPDDSLQPNAADVLAYLVRYQFGPDFAFINRVDCIRGGGLLSSVLLRHFM